MKRRRRLSQGNRVWAIHGALFGGFVLAACSVHIPFGPEGTQYPPDVSETDTDDTGQTDVETDFMGGGTGGGFIGSGAELDTTPVVLAATPPRPLIGGTMLLGADGVTLVAADPDRETLWWTNQWAGAATVVRNLVFTPGAEPGRIVEDGAGLIHVVLRGAGAVATVDVVKGTIVRQTPVCPAPRGVAYDATQNAVVVACVGGELVTLSATDDSVLRSVVLDTDLHDPVVLASGYVAVSKLRNAEVLLVDPTGAIASRTRPVFDASVDASSAWRMVGLPGGTRVVMTHELATTSVVNVAVPNAYGGGTDGTGGSPPLPSNLSGELSGIVTSVATTLAFDLTTPTAGAKVWYAETLSGALPIDVALDTSGNYASSIQYGSAVISFSTGKAFASADPAIGSATSIASDANGLTYVFLREPAGFATIDSNQDVVTVSIPAPSVADTGHDLFHRVARPGVALACASCHPEGRDDGRVWNLAPDGLRRTPSLVGGLSATAPFHWTGSLATIDAVMTEVFTGRMGGDIEDAQHTAAVERFLNAIPRVPVSPVPASSSASYAHGQQLFQSSTLGCTGCHSGAHLTDNATVDVGTGQAFQVPTLIGVGLRAPYLHDGCAATLADRFGSCGGGPMHGNTAQLSPSDIADLVTYLQTL